MDAVKTKPEPAWPRLPLLEQTAAALNLHKTRPFDGLRAVVCQHLLPSVAPLFKILFELGLEPTRTVILGKYYSSAPSVVEWLKSSGCTVTVAPAIVPGRYDHSLHKSACDSWAMLSTIPSTMPEPLPLIGVDHGGFLRQTYPQQPLGPSVFVEHTSRGTREAHSEHICVDMARSAPKREIESGIIAHQLLEGLKQWPGILLRGSIGILGMGPIGQALARTLAAHGCTVIASDPKVAPHAITETGAHYIKDPHELVESSRLLLGCTGSDVSHYLSAAGSQLTIASCSSSDIEFSSLLFTHRDELTFNGRDYILHLGGRALTILDRGFPVNFSWAVHNTDPSIALTRSLTLLSMVQAARILQQGRDTPIDRLNPYVDPDPSLLALLPLNGSEDRIRTTSPLPTACQSDL